MTATYLAKIVRKGIAQVIENDNKGTITLFFPRVAKTVLASIIVCPPARSDLPIF